jgi:hypothetical protein
MTVKTQGPRRGLIGRWVMRFEASGQVLRIGFQGTTAASAASGVLAYTGRSWMVPALLGIGAVAAFLFAYVYVEWGIYNRKNRERQVRGNNFAKPQNLIDDAMIGRAVLAGRKGRPLTDEEREAILTETREAYLEFKDGVDA